jgi:hypothetical protein
MYVSLTFSCSLAYAELYMVFGLLVRRMGSSMGLFKTDKEVFEIHYDRFEPTLREGTRGVRVVISPKEAE